MLAAHAGFRGLVGMFGGGSGEAEKTWGNSRSRTIPLTFQKRKTEFDANRTYGTV
jgi:hypothetical protein